MSTDPITDIRRRLEARKSELDARLARITANVRRGLESDSEEQAKQLEDSEVVDALGNEARAELEEIKAALKRVDSGGYGVCERCGTSIAAGRLHAQPYARACIDCAELDEEMDARN